MHDTKHLFSILISKETFCVQSKEKNRNKPDKKKQ